jgi:hypothetical protein
MNMMLLLLHSPTALAELDMLLKFFILLFTKYAEKIFSADFFCV